MSTFPLLQIERCLQQAALLHIHLQCLNLFPLLRDENFYLYMMNQLHHEHHDHLFQYLAFEPVYPFFSVSDIVGCVISEHPPLAVEAAKELSCSV